MTKNTDTLVAKPIIKDKFWVVTDGEKKVGNIEADGTQYRVVIGDATQTFDTAAAIPRSVPVRFEKSTLRSVKTMPYAVWPTTHKRTYNNMMDIVRRLHVFTTTPDSRCYYAAGWFARRTESGAWQTELCPKYIFLKRYEYYGPYVTEQEALAQINTLQHDTDKKIC